jgi:N-acetylmuramoyl-L-alanine amidase
LFLWLGLAVAGMLLMPPASAQRSKYIRYSTAFGRNYVYLRDVAGYYGMSLTPGREGCELRSSYSKVRVTYDKRQAEVNGVKINFLFAPFRQGAEPLVSEMDFMLVIEPVLRAKSVPVHRVATIMIDPGHGGADFGASGTLYREKDITLRISQKLRDALQRRGYRVVMTRNGDSKLELSQRTDACSRQRPDLFVSVHCNAAAARTARGIETFVMTPAKAPSTSDQQGKDKAEPGNRSDRQNMRLGYSIHQQLVLRGGTEDRGVRHARFYVLRNVACPAVLVETGFLSNYADQVRLGRDDYQRIVAESIADGIARYHRDIRGGK